MVSNFRNHLCCCSLYLFYFYVCDKYLANGKDLFWAFMDLEIAYDTIDLHGMWQMLREYGIGRKLLKAVQSFYIDSRACVRVGDDVSEWFPVNIGFRQSCAMSPWLFNVYIDGVVQEVNVRMPVKGLQLLSANCGWFKTNQLLFADDTALTFCLLLLFSLSLLSFFLWIGVVGLGSSD